MELLDIVYCLAELTEIAALNHLRRVALLEIVPRLAVWRYIVMSF